MSVKEVPFQVPNKALRLYDGWITHWIRQWVPNCRNGDWGSRSAKDTATKPRNIQFATAGRTEMSATGNVRDCHAAPWRSLYRRHRWTVTGSLHCTHCGIVSKCRSSGYNHERPHSCFQGSCDQIALQCSEPLATCLRPSLAQMPGPSYNNRLVMWQMKNQCLYWFIVQRATDTSHLTKPEEACLNRHLHAVCPDQGHPDCRPHTIVVTNHRLWNMCSRTNKYLNIIIVIKHTRKKLIVLLRHTGLSTRP